MKLLHAALATLLFVPFSWTSIRAQDSPWEGEWVSEQGLMTMNIDDVTLSGTYGDGGTITGTIADSVAELNYKKGNANGVLSLNVSDDGHSFTGRWNSRGRSGSWNGWKVDPNAVNQAASDWSGIWLTDWGTLQIAQNDDSLKGMMGAEGWADISGSVKGRRLELKWNRIKQSGEAWLLQTPDGKRLYGMSSGKKPRPWIGIRLEGHQHRVAPVAGETVKGCADNGMLYHLRMPDGWKRGDTVDTIVLLHGSNWTTAGMVPVTARNWPSVGKKFAVLGIQGQNWAKWSNNDDLRFNYTYTSWTGRSTYKGFPNTDRQSPYLVMNVIRELREQLSFGRVFVGGHSQGGFLTYILHMHFPEDIDGTFPVAGGLIIQSEPDVFDDQELVGFQKATPMAIVHGKKDNVVRYSSAAYAHNRFIGHGFGKVKLISPEAGHPYDFLPINHAIEYLDMMTTDDATALVEYATSQAEQKNWREVGLAIEQAKVIDAGALFSRITETYETEARKEADKQTKAVTDNLGNDWVDDFVQWADQFGTSNTAVQAMTAWQALRNEHTKPAAEAMKAAKKAFAKRQSTEGYKYYEEIATKYYAAPIYRQVRQSLENRK